MDTTTYYKKELYPLQDRVLKVLDNLKTSFYLTGGTALSRCYYNHRYSDDLDLFVNNDAEFIPKAEKVIRELEKDFNVKILTRTDTFYSFQLDEKLRADLVNDVAAYIGNLERCSIYSKVDNVLNILSNKVSSVISREEPKDVVDIWIIAKNEKIDWKQIFVDVTSKAVGIFPPNVAEKLDLFPIDLLNKINWVEDNKPNKKDFEIDIKGIILDILKLS